MIIYSQYVMHNYSLSESSDGVPLVMWFIKYLFVTFPSLEVIIDQPNLLREKTFFAKNQFVLIPFSVQSIKCY